MYLCAHAQNFQSFGQAQLGLQVIVELLYSQVPYVVLRRNPSDLGDGEGSSFFIKSDHICACQSSGTKCNELHTLTSE